MLNRKTLIRSAVGLIMAGVLAVPAIAAAATVAPVGVTPTVTRAGAGCDIALAGTWNEADTRGPTVTVQLWRSTDGAPATKIGFHERITDNGSDSFPSRFHAPGTHSFEFRITKGPKHVIGIGTVDIVCPPAS